MQNNNNNIERVRERNIIQIQDNQILFFFLGKKMTINVQNLSSTEHIQAQKCIQTLSFLKH